MPERVPYTPNQAGRGCSTYSTFWVKTAFLLPVYLRLPPFPGCHERFLFSVVSRIWWHVLDLGGGQEKPLSSASFGPCLSPAPGFLGYLNFTFWVMETSAVTVPGLAFTSLETHSCQSPLWYHEGAGKLILLPSISPFCSVFVLTRARAILPGSLRTFLSTLCLSVTSLELLAGAHVLFVGFDQRHLKLLWTAEVIPHFTGQTS